MKIFERYFSRNLVRDIPDFGGCPDMIVVVPVLDDPDVFRCLDTLAACECRKGRMGVIVVVNHSEAASSRIREANRILAGRLREYRNQALGEGKLPIFIMEAFDLPARYAGVGLARKLGMDAAALWLYRYGRTEAPILSLDADTLVDPSYPDVISEIFRTRPIAGLSVAYAHRLEECEGEEALHAMVIYELYLRYYQLALRYIGHPHAYACIGSAFAVRASDYVAQGGMNRKQAGEDFYFIQKLVATGRYAETDATRVYPSPRFSSRTPFGTGRSLRQIVAAGGRYPVYSFEAFRVLKPFFAGIGTLYGAGKRETDRYFLQQDPGLQDFMSKAGVAGFVEEANSNAASAHQFVRRFYEHFNAFRVLKYLNHVHVSRFGKTDIGEAAAALFHALGFPYSEDLRTDLEYLRKRG